MTATSRSTLCSLLDEESFQRAGVEVLAKSEAEFPVDFEEGIDDRRSNLAVQQRLIGSHARILDDRSERCGIFSMQCRSFRCPAVGVLRPSPFLKNVSGRPGAPKPMGVSAGSPSSTGWSKRFRKSRRSRKTAHFGRASLAGTGSPSPLFLLRKPAVQPNFSSRLQSKSPTRIPEDPLCFCRG